MLDEVAVPVRVLLVDDEALLRAGVRMILGHAGDIDVVGEAADGAEALDRVRRGDVDVVLMDLRMPVMDGLAATAAITAHAPWTRVVILTTLADHAYIAKALHAGAVGFLLKDSAPQELIMAVRAAASGHSILSPGVTRPVIDGYLTAEPVSASRARQLVSGLTEREREVLVLVGVGLSNSEAARRLYMGEGTVKTHVSNILAKLGCANRVQAAIIAHDAGIIPAPGEADAADAG